MLFQNALASLSLGAGPGHQCGNKAQVVPTPFLQAAEPRATALALSRPERSPAGLFLSTFSARLHISCSVVPKFSEVWSFTSLKIRIFIYFFFIFSVCVHIFICVCVQVYLCAETRGNLGRHTQEHCLPSFRQGLSLVWSSPLRGDWEISVIPMSLSLLLWNDKHVPSHPTFFYGFRD